MCEPQSWAQQQHGLHRMLVGGGRPATPLLRTGAALITAAALVQDGCRAGPPHRPAGLHGPQRAACPAAAPVGQPRAAAAAAAPAAGGCAGAGLERPVSHGGGMWQPSTGWGQARAATASSSGESGEGVSRGGSRVPARGPPAVRRAPARVAASPAPRAAFPSQPRRAPPTDLAETPSLVPSPRSWASWWALGSPPSMSRATSAMMSGWRSCARSTARLKRPLGST